MSSLDHPWGILKDVAAGSLTELLVIAPWASIRWLRE
jgi:hypothetical protein